MLQNGAKKDSVNTVGRNSAQMAAFVGQHQCVAVINNYYDKEDLEYYTVPRGQEKEPMLPPMVLPALLKLLNMANMHPVKISLHLQDRPELMKESYKVCKVLDLICEKSMKARDTDDITAMKAHYFATVIRKAKDETSLDVWIKKLLKGRESDGYPEFQDKLIRQALKEFPYIESQLLQNMDKQLSTTKIGDQPTSLNILNQGVNGHKFGFDETNECSTCGEQTAVKKCSACKIVHYCSPKCQKLHWFTHKKFCKQLAVTSGLEGETGPDFQYFLNDPDITGAFEDPEVAAALNEINEDPASITKYQDNEKLIRLINIIPVKLKAYQSSGTTLYVRK